MTQRSQEKTMDKTLELGRREEVEEVVVTWAYSVALVWLV
jgi:hypothetical protein